MTAVAHLSPISGRGVVYTEDNTFIIELDKMYQPEEADCTHLGMWMQGLGDIQVIDAGKYPFRAVYDRMKESHDKIRNKPPKKT